MLVWGRGPNQGVGRVRFTRPGQGARPFRESHDEHPIMRMASRRAGLRKLELPEMQGRMTRAPRIAPLEQKSGRSAG